MLRPCCTPIALLTFTGFMFAFATLATPASADLKPPSELKTQADVGQFLDTYYMQPRPQWIAPAFKILAEGPLLTNPAARSPLIVFIGTTTRTNSQPIAPLIKLASRLSKEQAGVIYAGLWFANTHEARIALQQVSETSGNADIRTGIDDLLQKQPPDLGRIPIDSPAILDMLWAQYLASGQTEALQRIISTLPWVKDQGKVDRYVIGYAARESLIANCKRHPAVLRYCRETLNGQPQDAQRILQQVIDLATMP